MPSKGKYTDLFIIGNGFDRWLELPTSYDDFWQYYKANSHRIAKELNCLSITNSKKEKITPAELIFGNVFNPRNLPGTFFWNFEESLKRIDDQELNYFFGVENENLELMQKCINQAVSLLKQCFFEWISSIDIKIGNSKFSLYHFPTTSYFINFNYTETLQELFGVEENSVYHIHGQVRDGNPGSLIVGHSSHPETAFEELIKQEMGHSINGGKAERLIGLYYVEKALYETDKGVMDNIDSLCKAITLNKLHIEDIENIYVLGQSMAEVDFGYFDFLGKATQVGCNYGELSAIGQLNKIADEIIFDEEFLLQDIILNVTYACHHREREYKKAELLFPEGLPIDPEYDEAKAAEAVHRRFLLEQSARTKDAMDELARIRKASVPKRCRSVLELADYIDGGHRKRRNNAKWHISCFSPKSMNRYEEVMKRAGINDYQFYDSIDECLKAAGL